MRLILAKNPYFVKLNQVFPLVHKVYKLSSVTEQISLII